MNFGVAATDNLGHKLSDQSSASGENLMQTLIAAKHEEVAAPKEALLAGP